MKELSRIKNKKIHLVLLLSLFLTFPMVSQSETAENMEKLEPDSTLNTESSNTNAPPKMSSLKKKSPDIYGGTKEDWNIKIDLTIKSEKDLSDNLRDSIDSKESDDILESIEEAPQPELNYHDEAIVNSGQLPANSFEESENLGTLREPAQTSEIFSINIQ